MNNNNKGVNTMYEPKLEKEIRCPLEYGLDIFGGKWKSRIICVLATNGTMRYNAIRKELCNITYAVLAAMLKEMLADELLDRKQFNQIPPKVEYSLTAKGESAVPILQSICQWSRAHIKIDKGNALPPCKTCTQI